MRRFKYILLIVFMLALPLVLLAQMDDLHGDQAYSMNGLHSGNMIRTTFWNDGQVGLRANSPTDIAGEWPIGSSREYIVKVATYVQAEVKNRYGETIHITSESNGTQAGNPTHASSGDSGPNGEWWTMCPLPGFANMNPPAEESDQPRVAMSHWDWSWPETWPDKFDDPVDPGWPGSWNGYFGKNILNADQESYYVIDDYQNKEFPFYPDSTDSLRRGLGMRVTVRGFQWSQVLVEDILFLLYDVKNVGTHLHDKVNFGMLPGPNIGAVIGGPRDGLDDGGAYDLEEDLGYMYDDDNIGDYGFTPVGSLGIAFLESPGNPYDGIDNDGDGDFNGGPAIDASMFEPVTFNEGDEVIVIDYQTFERTIQTMPAEGIIISYLGKEYSFAAGEELEEIQQNLIDDNLNGIIDENNGSVFGEGVDAIERFLYLGLRYVNYATGEGADNILIDERRDDGIDNDGDWNVLTDDVGLDGVANTGDPGEGDGVPTSGRGTDLTGEPHIDKTDIDESDMIGLTAFNIFEPWTIYPLYDDEILWEATAPGFLNATGQIGNTDVLLGSGYFPMAPEQIERFSVGYIMGYGDELFRNKGYAEKTYNENYNFAKAPIIPTVTGVPGDNRITLIWDDAAEYSDDPIGGQDFEGYKIYRSTDSGWNDMIKITDGYGSVIYRKPLAQFDLDNDIEGFHSVSTEGIQFWMGENTGLTHTFVDTTVKNGQKYYYAVTSYDRGLDSLGIGPAECAKYISILIDGTIDKGRNIAIVRPESPSAGFVEGGIDMIELLPGATT
ncbi:hypothetical protein HQ585_06645, partial [candidate division KSB1 bacterium]|nr:hypothetical protein [candidate division KSB1 bacterium]